VEHRCLTWYHVEVQVGVMCGTRPGMYTDLDIPHLLALLETEDQPGESGEDRGEVILLEGGEHRDVSPRQECQMHARAFACTPRQNDERGLL
jgi:hypothetical protein